MRHLIYFIVLCLFSCQSADNTNKLRQTVAGQWIILYPDHKLKNKKQREVYGKVQDSIVSLLCLKLVTLTDDGIFRQTDSINTEGRWGITPDNMVIIEKGGKGFEHYSAQFTSYKDDVLRLTEFMPVMNEKIELVWHLKKVRGNTANLFTEKRNAWRKRPAQPESEAQIKKRLSEMLLYYADYYELVNDESTYFIPSRVIIPFKFYQHAMGLKEFDPSGAFARLFFDQQQAEDAHDYLSAVMNKFEKKYPFGGNYVTEYRTFMRMLGYEIEKI